MRYLETFFLCKVLIIAVQKLCQQVLFSKLMLPSCYFCATYGHNCRWLTTSLCHSNVTRQTRKEKRDNWSLRGENSAASSVFSSGDSLGGRGEEG